MSMSGSMRQNRSGQTAMKPMSAIQAQVSRMAWFTSKISWITTTPPPWRSRRVAFRLNHVSLK
jgi:hypothetical protein